MDFGGDLDAFFGRGPASVREDLLAREGVGPETADSILLYASEVATFVVDAYTVRIVRRIGLVGSDGVDRVKTTFERHVPRDLATYREYHALLVAHGKATCRPRPRCDECPVLDLCDYGLKTYATRCRR